MQIRNQGSKGTHSAKGTDVAGSGAGINPKVSFPSPSFNYRALSCLGRTSKDENESFLSAYYVPGSD